jgi:hypothetical protein
MNGTIKRVGSAVALSAATLAVLGSTAPASAAPVTQAPAPVSAVAFNANTANADLVFAGSYRPLLTFHVTVRSGSDGGLNVRTKKHSSNKYIKPGQTSGWVRYMSVPKGHFAYIKGMKGNPRFTSGHLYRVWSSEKYTVVQNNKR